MPLHLRRQQLRYGECRAQRVSVVFFFLTALLVNASALCQDNGEKRADATEKNRTALSVNKPEAFQGYTLIAAMNSKETYLINMEGRVVNSWKSDHTPALTGYLLKNGNLLRPACTGQAGFMPGAGGKIEEFTWDGELVWEYTFEEESTDPHHDICAMPNGNVLVIAWDKKKGEEAITMGRNPQLTKPDGQFLPDCILEIKPTGPTMGEIVWQWHAWDHLIQDFNKAKPNYGDVSEHPELIDINYRENMMAKMLRDPEELSKLRSLGYVGGGTTAKKNDDEQQKQEEGQEERRGRGPHGFPGFPGGRRGPTPDWMHTNSIDYNPELDQIMLSIHEFHEVWIIDHSTTSEEAASHKGGRYGKGGDLLFRWGNPRAYRNGTKLDQRLFAQHNAQWIPKGLPGEGNMLVFNNGGDRPDGNYSSVDEIVLPTGASGDYEREDYVPFGPERATWSYSAPNKSDFFSMLISGAHRLPNGNTQVCSGMSGTVFEVTPDKEIVWKYQNPSNGSGFPLPLETKNGGVSLIPDFLQRPLGLGDDQRHSLNQLEAKVKRRLDGLLSSEQSKTLAKPRSPFGSPGGFRPPKPGEVVPDSMKDELKLNDEQSDSLNTIQNDVDARIAEILNDEQKDSLKRFASFTPPPGFSPTGFRPPSGSRRPGFPPRPGGPGRRGRRQGGPPGFGPADGPPGLFRSYRYGPDFAGLQGKDLTSGDLLEDVLAKKADDSSGEAEKKNAE